VIATKVWTPDDAEADRQIEQSLGFFGGRIEVLQIHNMVGWRTRLDQIEARRDRGEIVLVGATHWQAAEFDALEAAMQTGRVDMVQVPYNPIEREVEQRILPLAADMGIGVILMRPFAKRGLLGSPPSDDDLRALGGISWPHALVAWGLAHNAVSATIPATQRPERAIDNALAGRIALTPEQRDLITRLATS
jgi:aryl-alcohol dehydrogenase-like predicted oxidoreductase